MVTTSTLEQLASVTNFYHEAIKLACGKVLVALCYIHLQSILEREGVSHCVLEM
jgi:hypothetical protein